MTLRAAPGTGWALQKAAVAWATRSRFWKVKPSAITARQPSVPNLIFIRSNRHTVRTFSANVNPIAPQERRGGPANGFLRFSLFGYRGKWPAYWAEQAE